MSLQASFEIARRAMRSQQYSLHVIGNNIANANTPGYSRRRVTMQAGSDIMTLRGAQGTGVRVGDVSRVRDTSLDTLFRQHNTQAGKWFGLQQGLGRVEGALLEPGDGGLNQALSEFWASWQDLANEPENQTLRLQVRQRAVQLTQVFHRLDNHLTGVQRDLEDDVSQQVTRINDIGAQLADINKGLVQAEIRGEEASSLRDERDRLLDELSEIVDVQTSETPTGSMTVHLGSQVLVQEEQHRSLEVTRPGGAVGDFRVVWQGGSTEANVGGGMLEGYLQANTEHIRSYRADLDALAAAVVNEVNAMHESGYGLDGNRGRSFFDSTTVTAGSMRLSTAVLDNLDAIAASAGGEEGDGNHALAIAGLSTQGVLSGGRASFADFFAALTGRIGMDSQEASSFLESEEMLVLDVEARRQNVHGVSIDEEMTAMLTTQHAYEAMIRVTQTIDEMTVSILNMV